MIEVYALIGILGAIEILRRMRGRVIALRRKGTKSAHNEASDIALATTFISLAWLLVWPVVTLVVGMMIAVGVLTIPELIALAQNHKRDQ